jgi:hypothetical protein
MSLNMFRSSDGRSERFAPFGSQYASLLCMLLLTAACALASFAFACATPFAAFAVFAAAMLPFSAALLVVTAAWLVNQTIGFGVLGYPIDLNTILWGFAIGAAALFATVSATVVLHLLPRINRTAALCAALVGAYLVYEAVLLAFTPALGGGGAFAITIIARLGLLNILWTTGLVAVYEGLRVLYLERQRRLVT